jgi:hypothetical protein
MLEFWRGGGGGAGTMNVDSRAFSPSLLFLYDRGPQPISVGLSRSGREVEGS